MNKYTSFNPDADGLVQEWIQHPDTGNVVKTVHPPYPWEMDAEASRRKLYRWDWKSIKLDTISEEKYREVNNDTAGALLCAIRTVAKLLVMFQIHPGRFIVSNTLTICYKNNYKEQSRNPNWTPPYADQVYPTVMIQTRSEIAAEEAYKHADLHSRNGLTSSIDCLARLMVSRKVLLSNPCVKRELLEAFGREGGEVPDYNKEYDTEYKK